MSGVDAPLLILVGLIVATVFLFAYIRRTR